MNGTIYVWNDLLTLYMFVLLACFINKGQNCVVPLVALNEIVKIYFQTGLTESPTLNSHHYLVCSAWESYQPDSVLKVPVFQQTSGLSAVAFAY